MLLSSTHNVVCACLQDTRAADGRTNMLRYLAERFVSEEPPQAVLSTQVPHVLSAPLKTSLMVCSLLVPSSIV